MSKFQEVKTAIKNTPPERLAKIEYQSHFMHMIGVSIVCGILIFKGFWWIIFAFVFSLGVTFSQWISAHQKYRAIVSLIGRREYDYDSDKSFTRKRDYIIKQAFGKFNWILMAIASFAITYLAVPRDSWYMNIAFSLVFLMTYIFLYFFLTYWVAKYFWDRRG